MIIAGVILMSFPAVRAQDIDIVAYLSKTAVTVNQEFELNIELSGSGANDAPPPAVPDLGNFAAYLGSGTSTSMQWTNGQMSTKITYSFHYVATLEGSFTIPAIEYPLKGKTLKTQPIDITVTKSRARTPARRQPTPQTQPGQQTQDIDELVYLKAEVDKKRVYQNEPIVVSYQIYFALQITTYGIPNLPNTVGFWTEDFEMPSRPQAQTKIIDGQRIQVAEIKKVALFPQSPGEKELEPLVVECEIQVPDQRRRRSAFDSFFDDPFFGFNRTVRRRIACDPVRIEVMPLPTAGRPDNFSGAVGQFEISASADKLKAKTNEAVTLEVRIAGAGNIKILPEPDISFPSDFEAYDPKVNEIIKRTGNRVSGSKIFEYVLIPRFPGTQTIPAIEFSYFDPILKRYRTIATDPIDIAVEKGAQQFVTGGLATSKEDVKFIGQDIRFIQTQLPNFRQRGTVFYRAPLFFLSFILPLAVLASSVLYSKHQAKLISNVAYARSKKANQMALKRLKAAQKEMGRGAVARFYSEVSNAMMGFIGDKLNVSAAGLITDEVGKILKEKGIVTQVVDGYLECLKTCDFQRFAPSNSENTDMASFFEKAKSAIVTLDKQL